MLEIVTIAAYPISQNCSGEPWQHGQLVSRGDLSPNGIVSNMGTQNVWFRGVNQFESSFSTI